MRALKNFLCGLALFMGLSALASQGKSPHSNATLEQIMQSVVWVQVTADTQAQSSKTLGPYRSGSGVVIGKDLVLTVGYLLIEAEAADIVDMHGRKLPSTILGYDPISGFGLIRALVPLQLTPVPLGDSDQLTIPQKVLTLGHNEPEPTELLLVSRKPFAGSWEYLIESPLLTIPAVNNWSGAALFDHQGALVGLGSLLIADATSGPSPRPGNLYLPINLFKSVMTDLVSLGKRSGPGQAWIGVYSQPHPQGGLVIQRIAEGSPASFAGLQPGDRILALQNQAVLDLADFYKRLWSSGPIGSSVNISYSRNGETRTVSVITGDRMKALRKPTGV